jgi:hypothetical protein|tara:strand:+ start:970 stop:1374 length:405 start_codon:yes stop_codon:yes gene_type:complete
MSTRNRKEVNMTKTIKVTTFSQTGEDSFSARGTCDNKAFIAKTIIWQGEPIFKVQESSDEGEFKHLKMTESEFNRGERISIARHLKKIRLGEASVDEFDSKTVKELRSECKARGLSGYHAKGVTKDDLIAKLAA